MDWFAAGLILIGNVVLIKSKSWKTFLIFLLGNLIYTYWWFINHQWATMALTSVFVAMNIWGIYSWKWKERKSNVRI